MFALQLASIEVEGLWIFLKELPLNLYKLTILCHLDLEAKLHDESRLIQICFDDYKDNDKGDDKKLKGQ